jgi:tetratricopeptide (TPR) repeat protein
VKLAVLVLACNEDNVLGRCLTSVQGLECHVSVDTKTTDETWTVADKFGAETYQHTFLDNSWAATRNALMEKVEHVSEADWFLWLDADEWLMEGRDLLTKAIGAADAAGCDGIEVTLRDVPLAGAGAYLGEWANCKCVRRGVRYQRRRHEVFPAELPRVQAREVVIGHQKAQRPEVVAANARLKADTDALLADYEEFRDTRSAFYVADAYHSSGRVTDALVWFQHAANLPQTQLGVREMVLTQLSQALRQADRYADALSVDQQHLVCGRAEVGESCFDLGIDHLNLGQLDDAEFYLRLAIAAGSPEKLAGIAYPDKTGRMAYFGLAHVALRRGNALLAAGYLGQARSMGDDPRFVALQVEIAQALLPQPEPEPDPTPEEAEPDAVV